MWKPHTTSELNGRAIKLTIHDATAPLPFAEVLRLWRDDEAFRSFFIAQLSAVPFVAYRWETPPLTITNIHRDFECVVLESPELVTTPDVGAFAEHFPRAKNDIAVFPNLGNNALLIAPCPVDTHSAYGHLAAFIRHAPERQIHAMWQRIGETMLDRLTRQPIWLNTAGAGVSWLHVRLDSQPKYYRYAHYKVPAY